MAPARHPSAQDEPESIEPQLSLSFKDGKRPELIPPQFIKAEANLLRWPIFSLATKTLKNVDQIHCEGVKREGTKEHRFSLTVSRNTRYTYPGPLARKVHMALQSMLVDGGYPFSNPIVFTWRQLARRIGISINGTKIARMKEAIRSIQGIIISTEYALKSGGDNKEPLPFRDAGYSLYRAYVFEGVGDPNSPAADMNAVWFDDWLLANLNAFYVAPLDYHLWKSLNDKSPIASRLYEFLLYTFTGRHPSLPINYANLAQFLPVRVVRYLSDAQKQLGPAFNLLEENLVIRSVQWLESKTGALQVHIVPGPLLSHRPKGERLKIDEEPDLLDQLQVSEITTQLTPSQSIAQEFYRLWVGHVQTTPTKPELAFADELLDRYGRAQVLKMLPGVVKAMKQHFPSAKSFNATRRYFEAAYADIERRKAADERATHEEQQLLAERERQAQQQQRRAELEERWQALPPAEQEGIRQYVLSTASKSMKLEKMTTLLHRFCIDELARRLESPAGD